MASPYQIISYQKFILGLMRLAPSELFNEATTTLLMPSVRSIGPLTMEQVQGAIPSPLPLGQSLLVVWPQLTGLIAATVICFAISYIMFMRREIRSRKSYAESKPDTVIKCNLRQYPINSAIQYIILLWMADVFYQLFYFWFLLEISKQCSLCSK